jgi:hypothetical protein
VNQPVLLPPTPPSEGALPGWAFVLGVTGILVLAFVTLPAVVQRTRLERVHARLVAETEAQERSLDRLTIKKRDCRGPSYLRVRETRRLLHPGP